MPYSLRRVDGYSVRSPGKVHAKNTTKAKAEAQIRLLRAEEHDPHFKPRRKAKKKSKGRKKR
jgi:hypothetical protein